MKIPVGTLQLNGDLILPAKPKGLILFAHGSGSSRLSPRNQYVARVLQNRSWGTLLFDLLTLQEETVDDRTAELRFDIPLLAQRLKGATHWVRKEHGDLPLGYFGASTGAAAALRAAADLGTQIGAVVSRGGRPDLAGVDALTRVKAPTLLIVGSLDHPVIGMNQEALLHLKEEKKLEIVPGATHLFEEPGKLEIVADLAANWFGKYLNN